MSILAIKPKNWTRQFTVISLEKLFESIRHPIVVNELPTETEDDRKKLRDFVVTQYDTTDVMDTVPTCPCRRTREKVKEGKICPYCGGVVESHHNKEIQHDVWIKAPKAIGRFPIPLFWLFLKDALSTKNFDGLRWACDPKYPDPDLTKTRKDSKIVKRFMAANFQRGLSNLEKQLDIVLEVAYAESTKDYKNQLAEFVSVHHDKLFSTYIPIPSKIAVAVEKTAYTNFVDGIVAKLLEAVMTAANTGSLQNVRTIESRFTTVMTDLCDYLSGMVKDTLDGHNGWYRRVLYGTRMNFSFRGIISSYHGLHEYDTIMVPYSQLLVCLEPIILRKLMLEHGFSLSKAMAYTREHATDYDDLLWGMLEEVIDDTPPAEYHSTACETVVRNELGVPVIAKLPSTLKTRERKGGGIYCAITRYPSLARGSTQGMRIVGITKSEIRISVLCLVSPNADKHVYKEAA